jgi:hypothetical protein
MKVSVAGAQIAPIGVATMPNLAKVPECCPDFDNTATFLYKIIKLYVLNCYIHAQIFA